MKEWTIEFTGYCVVEAETCDEAMEKFFEAKEGKNVEEVLKGSYIVYKADEEGG
jgi:hypothetical protein